MKSKKGLKWVVLGVGTAAIVLAGMGWVGTAAGSGPNRMQGKGP